MNNRESETHHFPRIQSKSKLNENWIDEVRGVGVCTIKDKKGKYISADVNNNSLSISQSRYIFVFMSYTLRTNKNHK